MSTTPPNVVDPAPDREYVIGSPSGLTRRSLLRASAAAGAAVGFPSAFGSVSAQAATGSSSQRGSRLDPNGREATVILAHGAFAESSSWDGVVSLLRHRGLRTISVAVPLRGVASDAAYVSDLVRTVAGPVVLVGHSYGGAVISAVNSSAGDIGALVYVAAFAPVAGETCAGLSGKFPGATLGPALTSVDLASGGRDLYIDQAKYRRQFCADVSDAKSAQMAVSQRPILESALSEPCGPHPLWMETPSWFIYGELDYNIPAAAHKFMAKRAHARRIVQVEGASHAVGVSHAKSTADMIFKAARAAAEITARS